MLGLSIVPTGEYNRLQHVARAYLEAMEKIRMLEAGVQSLSEELLKHSRKRDDRGRFLKKSV